MVDDPEQPAPALGLRAVLLLGAAVLLGWLLLANVDSDTFVAATEGSGRTTVPATTVPTTLPGEDTEPATTTPPSSDTRPPGEVAVIVANGTGTPGIAGRVSDRLEPQGYELLEPTDTTRTLDASSVQYQEGYEADAVAIAQSLQLPRTAVGPLEEVPPLQGGVGTAEVVVLVGPELDDGA